MRNRSKWGAKTKTELSEFRQFLVPCIHKQVHADDAPETKALRKEKLIGRESGREKEKVGNEELKE